MNPLRAIFLQISRIPPALMLVAIVGLAAAVAMVVADQLNKQRADYVDRAAKLEETLNKKTTVVFALKDIPEGQPIPAEAIEERQIPNSKAPQDSVSSITLVAGHVAKYGITANSPVSQHDLAPQAMPQGFEARLKTGMRALTFGVDNNTGVAGFVQPESRVDIIGMVGGGPDTKAAPILSDVEVIAVGQSYQKLPNGQASPSSSVTVAVTPEDTQKLVKSICASKIYLALRNDHDHTPIATVDVTSLFGKTATSPRVADISQLPPPQIPSDLNIVNTAQQAVQPLAEAPRAMHEIEIWSGSKKDLVTFAPN